MDFRFVCRFLHCVCNDGHMIVRLRVVGCFRRPRALRRSTGVRSQDIGDAFRRVRVPPPQEMALIVVVSDHPVRVEPGVEFCVHYRGVRDRLPWESWFRGQVEFPCTQFINKGDYRLRRMQFVNGRDFIRRDVCAPTHRDQAYSQALRKFVFRSRVTFARQVISRRVLDG